MSLSKPQARSTPAQRFFKIRASTGDVAWYDKGEGRERGVSLPFKFIVLDILTTIKGFHETSNSGIWSNEIRSTRSEGLIVRAKSGVIAEGTYDEIKHKVKAQGGKFAHSVYIAYSQDDEWTLGNINFAGAAVSAWFDFRQNRNLDTDPGVAITGFSEEKKGRAEYFVPTFAGWQVDPADLESATHLDGVLQAYLDTPPSVTMGAATETLDTPFTASFAGVEDDSPPF